MQKSFVIWLVSLALLVTSQEFHFKTQNLVKSARLISHKNGQVCDLLDLNDASHRMAYLTNQPVINVRPLVREIEPVDDGHHHDHNDYENNIITIHARNESQIWETIKYRCLTINDLTQKNKSQVKDSSDVVRELINTGDSSNRIDVVLMGDGYLASQLNQMESDMSRLVNDMWNEVTFSAYLPVFNIWSVFRASNEEGIGTGGKPKDTAFKLYRDGTELRGVYCGNASAARDACKSTGPNACDFPSIIGNDPYYGGLGGEFTISTQSPTSGTLVLRHEMGHNFISVGEEYDGGSSYFGVNHSPLRNGNNVPWQAWVSQPGNVQIEQSEIRVQDYAWYDLAKGAYIINFTTDGTYSRWMTRLSVSGCDTQNSISITLDGNPIPWVTHNSLDRFIDDFVYNTPLSAGQHSYVFRQLTSPSPGNPIRQLCSVTLHEYKAEPLFHQDDTTFVGAYPTWRQGKVLAGYRPSNELCLMRNMSSQSFCSPCYEGMWIRFFSMMSGIDEVIVQCQPLNVHFELITPKLGQLRAGGPQPGEYLYVKWYYNGNYMSQHDNQFTINVDKSLSGSWKVTVDYQTPLVRSDPNNVLHFEQNFNVPQCH